MDERETKWVQEALDILNRIDTDAHYSDACKAESIGKTFGTIKCAQTRLEVVLNIPEETILVCPYCGDIKEEELMCCGESSGHFEEMTLAEYEAEL